MPDFPSARTTVLLVAIGLLLIAGAAMGQPMPPAPGSAGACVEEPARFDGFRAYLRTRIAIHAEQDDAWEQFVTEARAGTKASRDLCAAPPDESRLQDPLQRMALRERFMAARLEALHGLRTALEKLATRLSDAQKMALTLALAHRPPGPPIPPPPMPGPR